jgi:hypothetical protein
VGTTDAIDIASLTLETPIWISPPVKVKHLGVITKIITSMYKNATTSDSYIEGLGTDSVSSTTSFTDLLYITSRKFCSVSWKAVPNVRFIEGLFSRNPNP